MDNAWIKMPANLWDDPRVKYLCEKSGCDEAEIVGALYWLWAYADQHSTEGLIPGLRLSAIDRWTYAPGLGSALVEIGWLEDLGDGVVVTPFDELND